MRSLTELPKISSTLPGHCLFTKDECQEKCEHKHRVAFFILVGEPEGVCQIKIYHLPRCILIVSRGCKQVHNHRLLLKDQSVESIKCFGVADTQVTQRSVASTQSARATQPEPLRPSHSGPLSFAYLVVVRWL